MRQIRQHPDRWERHQYDFHWHSGDPVPLPLVLDRKHQQDANREGLVAGTNGSVDARSERMGAEYAIGDQRIPIDLF